MIFNALCMHLDSGQMARSGKRTIVHCPCGVSRRFETLGGIYGCFLSVDSSGLSAQVPNLAEGYIERESNGTKTRSTKSLSVAPETRVKTNKQSKEFR